MKKINLLILLLILTSTTLVGCKGQDEETKDETKEPTVEVTDDKTFTPTEDPSEEQTLETPVVTIAQIKDLDEGSALETKGIVVSKNTRGYILKDETAYIYVYTYGSSKEVIEVGKEIKIWGHKNTHEGLLQIIPTKTTILNSTTSLKEEFKTYKDEELITYINNDSKEILPISFSGQLIMIKNDEKNFYYTNITTTNQEIEFTLTFLDSTLEEKLLLESGNQVKIEGYLMGYNNGRLKVCFNNLIKEEIEIKPGKITEELKKAFNYHNYTYTYTETFGDFGMPKNILVDNGNISILDLTFGNYEALLQVNKENRYYFKENDAYFYSLEGEEKYLEGTKYLYNLDLTKADLNWFYKDGNLYKARPENMDEVGKFFTGYTTEQFKFNEFSMVIENDLLKEITASNIDTSLGEPLTSVYKFEFSNFNTTKIEPKDATHYRNETNDSTEEPELKPLKTTVKESFDLPLDTYIEVKGLITSSVGNQFYLADGSNYVLVYLGKSADTFENFVTGRSVKVVGFTTEFNGVRQIGSVMSIEKASGGYGMADKLEDFNQETLALNIHKEFSLTNIKLETLPTDYSYDKDINFKISLNGVSVNVFISKHLAKEVKDLFFESLKALKVGDTFNLYNTHVGHYKEYQFIITDQSVIR